MGKNKLTKRTKFWILTGLALIFLIVIGSAVALKYTASNEFCISCHEMNIPYETHKLSKHKNAAGCNDCHADNSNVAAKVWAKGLAGARHGFIKIAGTSKQIKLSDDFSSGILQENCVRCHSNAHHQDAAASGTYCFKCHSYAGHEK